MPHIVMPAVVLAGLTFFMAILTGLAATVAVRRGELAREKLKLPGGDGPAWVERVRRNYLNLCEMPILFYAVVALEFSMARGDGTQLTLAWVYVGLRIAHSLYHVLVNYVLIRFALFLASMVVLIVMWGRMALAYSAGLA